MSLASACSYVLRHVQTLHISGSNLTHTGPQNSGQERCFHDFHKKNNMILEAGCSNVDAQISLIPQESKKEPRLNMHYRSTNAGCVMQSCKKTSNTTLLRDLKSKTH